MGALSIGELALYLVYGGLVTKGAKTHLLHSMHFILVNVSAIMWNVNEDGLSKKIVNILF